MPMDIYRLAAVPIDGLFVFQSRIHYAFLHIVFSLHSNLPLDLQLLLFEQPGYSHPEAIHIRAPVLPSLSPALANERRNTKYIHARICHDNVILICSAAYWHRSLPFSTSRSAQNQSTSLHPPTCPPILERLAEVCEHKLQ